MNIYTGEIKLWDDLTPEQQASGDWVKLPQDAGPAHAERTNSMNHRLAEIFSVNQEKLQKDMKDFQGRIERAEHRNASQFGNRGR